MKKIIYLCSLSFMLFSFESKSEEMISVDALVCCTATVTYNGEYHSSYTSCVDGVAGPENISLACSLARSQAEQFIAAQ